MSERDSGKTKSKEGRRKEATETSRKLMKQHRRGSTKDSAGQGCATLTHLSQDHREKEKKTKENEGTHKL